MKISPLELEHVVPGSSIIVERYFVQLRSRSRASGVYWADSMDDSNINGLRTPEMAKDVLIRNRVNYCDDIAWRIIKRICTITAEVVR